MRRNQFLTAVIAAAAMPASLWANVKKIVQDAGKGFKVKAGEGRLHGHIQLKGVNANVLDVKISGSDTDGGLAIFEQTSLSQGRGTPLHFHLYQDEVFYVLEGKYYFQVGDDKHWLTAGECIFLPKKVPHAWTQASEKGKMTVTVQPAGKLENFFVTMSGLRSQPTPEELAKYFSDSDMQIVGPALKIPV